MYHLYGAVMKNNFQPPLVHSEMYDFQSPRILISLEWHSSPVHILLLHLIEQYWTPELLSDPKSPSQIEILTLDRKFCFSIPDNSLVYIRMIA